jgi:hypothetical protein
MSVATSEAVDIPKVEINPTSEDIVDEGGAPVSRGDEGTLEGVAIGDDFDEGNSSGSDEDVQHHGTFSFRVNFMFE